MVDHDFGELTDAYAGVHLPARLWEFTTQADGFGEQLRVQFEAREGEAIPESVRAEVKSFLADSAHRRALAAEAILGYYRSTIRPMAIEHGFTSVAPEVTSVRELEALLSSPCLHPALHDDGSCALGLGFECVWDVEHGTGVAFRDAEVVDVGLGEVAFLG